MGSASPGVACSTKSWDCSSSDASPLACSSGTHGCIASRNTPLTDEECADVLLVNAVIRGELPDVRRALATGADPGTVADLALRTTEPGKSGRAAGHRTDGTTPVMRAATLGHADIVQCLVEARASLEDRDCRGWTPICHALGAAEIDIARMIHGNFTPEQLLRQRRVVDMCKPDVLDRCATEAGDATAELVRLELEAILAGHVVAGTGRAAGVSDIFGGKMLARDSGVGHGPKSAMILPRTADRSLQEKVSLVDSAEDTDGSALASVTGPGARPQS